MLELVQWIIVLCCWGCLHTLVLAQNKFPGESCENAAWGNSRGVCISPQQCPSVMNAVKQDGRTMSWRTLQLLRNAHCGFEYNFPLICCPVNELLLSVVKAVMLSAEDNNIEDTDDTKVSFDHPKTKLLPLEECGQAIFLRILHSPHQFLFVSEEAPTIVRLIYSTPRGRETFMCSGSLISRRYVLTAAQCVTNLPRGTSLMGAIVGDYNITTNPDCEVAEGFEVCRPPMKRVRIENIIPHPSYSTQNRQADIALLKLESPADYEGWEVIPSCLPLGSFQNLDLQNRDKNFFSTMGWGADTNGPNTEQIRIGTLKAVSGGDCERLVGPIAQDGSRIVCAKGKLQEDDKIADLGGPLSIIDEWMPNESARMIQVAVLTSRAQAGQPSAYTRIGPYLSWILNNIES